MPTQDEMSETIIGGMEREIDSLKASNTKLREALQFYANIHSASEARRIFVQDAGKRARDILDKQ